MHEYQRTLAQPIHYLGIGLHTGKRVSMVIKPTDRYEGIFFLRKDWEPGKNLIAARWYNVVDTTLSTVLGNNFGATVGTVEHLLAALYSCGIDNAIIEIDGPEVPIMDGSSGQFVSTIEKTGTCDQPLPRKAIWVHKPIEVGLENSNAILLPSKTRRITVEIDFPETLVGFQSFSVELVDKAFRNQIAQARTFGFADQIAQLHRCGFARGGSMKNAILIDGDRILNEEGLRYPDEFARHKVLDCVGDLALVGVPIFGHYFAHKPGHALNFRLISRLFSCRDSWSYTTLSDLKQMLANPECLLPLNIDELQKGHDTCEQS